MKREAIIHIGVPKTGTTSIQQVLKKRRADLPGQGAHAARSPGSGNHALLTIAAGGEMYDPGDEFWEGMAPRQRIEKFRAELAEEMNGLPAGVNRVIFTDERMSTLLNTPQHLKKLRTLLEPWFDRFTIVVYLRRQDALIASKYTQNLRAGMLQEPEKQLEDWRRLRDCDYQTLLDLWAAEFGDPAIRVRIYEKVGDRNFDSVADFLGLIGVTLELTEDDRARTLNPSISLAAQGLLRDVGRTMRTRSVRRSLLNEEWRALCQAATIAVPGKGWAPTQAEAAEFVARFAEVNEAVRQRFTPERPALFNDDFSNLPAEKTVVSDAETLDAAKKILAECVGVRLRKAVKSQRRVRSVFTDDGTREPLVRKKKKALGAGVPT
jgi:hypothetical protein